MSESTSSAAHAGAVMRPWTVKDIWPESHYIIYYLLLGLSTGVASGLLGIGGGILIVPILSGFLGVPMRCAVAISIVSVLGIATTGVVSELVARTEIPWLVAAILAVGAQGGVWIGSKVGPKLPERALRYAFVMVILLTAAKLAQLVPIGPSSGHFPVDAIGSWLLWVLLLGVFAGFLSVLLGIGGGIVVVPGLVFILDGIIFRAIQTASLAMIIPTALTGTVVHARQGNVLWRSVVLIVLPGFVGTIIGVVVANITPNEYLRDVIFPIFLCIVAVRLALKHI